MKVTITHSINLEDVPDKASELIIPAEELIANVARWLNSLARDLSNNNITAEMAVLSLDRCRRALGDCDHSLAEVEGILQGVADYEKSLETQLPDPAGLVRSTQEELDQQAELEKLTREMG